MAGRAAQKSPQPGFELPEIERLDQIIVGSKVEHVDLVINLGSSRNNEHRGLAADRAQISEHGKSILAGQHDVEDDSVPIVAAAARHSIAAITQPLDRMAFLAQLAADRIAEVKIVLNQQYAHVEALAQPMMPVVQLAPASGIMEKEGTRKAYVFKKNDPAGLWIGTGDEISKWKIRSIDCRCYPLRNGDRNLNLQMYGDDHQ
jgi:hypothetical protein